MAQAFIIVVILLVYRALHYEGLAFKPSYFAHFGMKIGSKMA